MPPLGLIERGNSDEPVHSNFAGEKSERIFAIDREGHRLQSRFFACLVVVEYGFESLTFSPSEIKAKEHVRPVLRLGSTRARMDGHDSVASVIFTGEQGFGFETIDEL